jgi:hypothetical protein
MAPNDGRAAARQPLENQHRPAESRPDRLLENQHRPAEQRPDRLLENQRRAARIN